MLWPDSDMLSKRRQRGVVLIVVLWVVALLMVLLAAFVAVVKVERQTVAGVSMGIQARVSTDAVLSYLAALNAVSAPELEEIQGPRYELALNEQVVSFRVLPENVFVPINMLSTEMLEVVLSGMGLDNAAELAEQLVELRSEGVDEVTGELRSAVQLQSIMHLAHLLGLNMEQMKPYERWFSFLGKHEQVAPGYVPSEVLSALGLHVEPEQQDGEGWLWDPAQLYRVQVEVQGGGRPRQVEATVSFSGPQYRLMQLNEYNADFSLNELSE